jgi:hypothetical protein
VTIEGAGTWLAARHGGEAFAADLKALANLTRPGVVVPFVGAGVGLYRASFEMSHGMMPEFYQQRMMGTPFGAQMTFTDPSFVFEGGANILVTPHLSLRPDLGVKMVVTSSSSYRVTVAAVHLLYHFEAHHVR